MLANPVYRNAAFRWLWAGTAVSALGSFVGALAIAFTMVKTLGASPGQVAAVLTVQLIAGMVAAPLAGVLVDRLRRRPLLIAADLLRAAMFLTLPFAHRSGHLTVGLVAVVSAVTGAANVLFNNAYGSLLPRVVGREHLIAANAAIAASVSVAEVAGFGLAGWLVQWLGAPNAVIVDSSSFVASALCIVAIRSPEPPRVPRGRTPRRPGEVWLEATAGVRYVAREPVLRALLGTAALYDISVALTGVSYLLYLSDQLGFGDGLLGSIFAIGGVTSLLGAGLARRAERTGNVGRSLVLAGAARTVGVAAMPAASSTGATGVGLLVANQVVTDPAWMLQEIAEVSIRQGRTPDEVAGRVIAAHQLAGSSGRLTGTIGAGVLGEAFGPRSALWSGVALCAVATVVLWRSPTFHVVRAGDPAGQPSN